MEDQSSEWEIMNYTSSLEDGEAEKTKLCRLLNTGLCLGKNLVITGVVISSVPLVLPPLVVISALGLAFSVPFGVVFASYACSQKLMSKLLPSLALPPIMSPYKDEEEVVANAVEKEEKEQREATKDEIETRIELVDTDDVRDDTRNLKQSLASTDERGYLEVGECSKEKDDESFVNNVKVDRLNKEVTKQHSLEPSKDIEKPCFSAVGADTGTGGNASETDDQAVVVPEAGNTGDRKSEGHESTSSSVKDAKITVPILPDQTDNLETEEREQNFTNKKERENFFEEAENEELEKSRNGIEGTEKEIEELGEKRTSTALRFPGKRKEPEGDKRYERLSGKETELVKETNSSSDSNLNLSQDMESKFGSREKLCAEEVVVQETSADKLDGVSGEKEQAGELEFTTFGSEYLDNKKIPGRTNQTFSLNDDVGNMDNSLEKEHKAVDSEEMWSGQSGTVGGVDINIEEHIVMVHNEPGENFNQSRMIANDGEDSFEVAVLTDMPESKHNEEISELKDADDACKVYSDLHSDEGLVSEEKIWKQIDAIRVIVGFKAPRRSSYSEELKALYLFTGIEPPPPSSSMEPSDLREFRNKLCLLMSVIGLK